MMYPNPNLMKFWMLPGTGEPKINQFMGESLGIDWGERKRIKSANHGNICFCREVSKHGARKIAERKEHELDAKEFNVQGLLSKETKFYFAMNQNGSSSLSSKT